MYINWYHKHYIIFNTDTEGNVPLWEAIMGKHSQSLIKLLVDHGANLASGDISHYVFHAIEQGDLELLRHIVQYGGDVTLPNNDGTTPLHAAISSGNVAMVEFLLEQGADIEVRNEDDLTPRYLADLHGNEEIKGLLGNVSAKKEVSKKSNLVAPVVKKVGSVSLKKYSSTGSLDFVSNIGPGPLELSRDEPHSRGRANVFQNSLFGVVSAASRGKECNFIYNF